jgi:hypothetical protein
MVIKMFFMMPPTSRVAESSYNLTFGHYFFFLFIGKMKGIAFIKDPDGYWIEIFNNNLNI